MPEQFKNINSFRAYQKQIYEYLNQRMIQVPFFFENQNAVNNTILPPNTSRLGGNFQQTIRDGKVVQGKTIDEVFVSFDNVYSNNQNDLSIIEYIAYKLNGLTPHETIIDVDAFIYTGVNASGLIGPVSTIEQYYEENASIQGQYVYLPYIDLKNLNEKLLLNYNSNLSTLQAYFNTIDIPNASFEDFKTQLLGENINLSVSNYNLSDNTNNFLPVGVQKRTISKKVLQDNSETEITEILPETDEYQVMQFFKLWEKTKQKIESGQEFIEGSTFLRAGNFAGGIGPGNYNFWLNTNTDGVPINLIDDSSVFPDYTLFVDNPYIPETNLWNPNNQSLAIASQRVIEQDNPGLSSFVYSTQRSAPVWYTINVEDLENNFKPGVSYTLSGWQTQDNEFNPSNYEELAPGHFFFFKLDAVMNPTLEDDENLLPVIEFPASNLEPSEFLPLIKGEAVEVWQGSEKIWTRYKKTFTIPVSDANEPVDVNGDIIDVNEWTGNYKLTWFLGYQNSVDLPGSNITNDIYNGAFWGGGIGETSAFDDESPIWDGPTIRSNTNYASQYYTGLRLNVGEQITGITKLPLQDIKSNSIARILQDCIKLLEPDFPQRNIPIYSEAKLQELILSQQNTALITTTLTEIKQGLIVALNNLVDGISDTFSGVAQSLLDPDVDSSVVLAELETSFQIMINSTGVKQQLEQLENTIQGAFSAVTTNFTGIVNEATINAYIQNLPVINTLNAPGFKLFPVGDNVSTNTAWESLPQAYGVHFGFGVSELTSNSPAIVSLERNIYLTAAGIDDGGYSNNSYLHASSNVTNFPDFYNTIPFFLNCGQSFSSTSQAIGFTAQGRNDFFYDEGQKVNLRNLISDQKSAFIMVEKLRYKAKGQDVGMGLYDENSDRLNPTSDVGGVYIDPDNSVEVNERFGQDGAINFIGASYDNDYFNDVIKKYLYQNTSTPIGAFYTSEMIEQGYSHSSRKGQATSYLYKPNNYPSVGYGPYCANNLPLSDTLIQDFGFSNGITRTQDVYRQYMVRYAEGNELFVSNNELKQFAGFQNLFQNESSLETAVLESEYFEELETYTLDFYSGIELMGFVYSRLFETDPSTGFGYKNIDIGSDDTGLEKEVKLSMGVNKGSELNIHNTPEYAREDFYHFGDPTGDGDGYFRGGKITMRFYEPHWEWNPIQEKFIFRLAQPIIGSEYGGGESGGNMMNTGPYVACTNYDIESGMNHYKFEKKYKFKKMAYITKEG